MCSNRLDIRSTLCTFDEKVDRLNNSSLWRFMTSSGWKISWDFQENKPGDEARVPERESLEAYILNLRFFIQDNEPTSLRNIASLYRTSCKSAQQVEQFRRTRDAINRELDRELWFKFNDKSMTYGKLLHGMIYSRFAHAHKDKHKLFDQMTTHPFGYMMAVNEFLRVLGMLHFGLIAIRNLNRAAFPSN
jgi:hypothetical protein